MPYEDVLKLTRCISEGCGSGMLYEDIVAKTGVEGFNRGNTVPNSMTTPGDHYFDRFAEDDPTHFIHVCFRGQEDTGRFECKQYKPLNGFTSQPAQSRVMCSIFREKPAFRPVPSLPRSRAVSAL